MHVSFQLLFSFSSDKHPELELLNHMTVLFLIFLVTSMLFSIVVAPIYNPTAVFEVSHFFTSSSAFVICCLLDGNHSKTCEVMHLCYD